MKYKRTNIIGEEYELEIIPNPIADDETIDDDRKLIIHYFLDNFNYLKNKKQNFVSGNYTLSYIFKNIDKKEEFSYYFSYRIFSLHYIIIQQFLPFKVNVLINRRRQMHLNLLKDRDYDKFFLTYDQKKWINLRNDLPILEKNIQSNSAFERVIIWFVFSSLSVTNTETFMNLFRSIETLTRERDNTDRTTKRLIKQTLIDIGCEDDKAQKLIDIRNKIAHGHSFEIEFNMEMIDMRIYLYPIIEKYIYRRIKNMNLIGLKSEQFVADYTIFKNSHTKKEILIDSDDLTKEKFEEYDKLCNFISYNKAQLIKLAKKMGFKSSKIKYLLYCYDYHKKSHSSP